MSNKIALIGAINLDINIHSEKPYLFHDSNIVSAIQNVGGVGGNIAQNLARLGHHITLFSVFGQDPISRSLKQALEGMMIDTSHSVVLNSDGLNLYLSILDEKNDLLLGLNDMKAMNHITIDYIQSKQETLEEYDTIIIDNNVPQETLEYIVNTYQEKQLIMDAVSVDKAQKLRSVTTKLSILKVNFMEYVALGETSLHHASLELLVSNGDQPIHLYHGDMSYQEQPLPCTSIQSSSGAGDALLSGYIDARLRGFNITKALKHAAHIAHLTLQSNTSTSIEVKPIG